MLNLSGAGESVGAALGGSFDFGVEIGDDFFKGRDCLLNGSDLHQFPAAHRAITVLQRDDQIAPLFLKLNKR
jgi:hypothetical protein